MSFGVNMNNDGVVHVVGSGVINGGVVHGLGF
jgi:hypothetical protein